MSRVMHNTVHSQLQANLQACPQPDFQSTVQIPYIAEPVHGIPWNNVTGVTPQRKLVLAPRLAPIQMSTLRPIMTNAPTLAASTFAAVAPGLVSQQSEQTPLVQRAVVSLLAAWEVTRNGLAALATNDSAPASIERDIEHGLQRMASELHQWATRHGSPEMASTLMYAFPRLRIGQQLHALLRIGTVASREVSAKMRLVEAAAHVATCIHVMSFTPQESSLLTRWQTMPVEAPIQGQLDNDAASFGKHLHMLGGVNGKVQTMQDWEWPYMYTLADMGFELAVGLPLTAENPPVGDSTRHRCEPRLVRILEVGWGQGISGRRLLDEARRTGCDVNGVEVAYEVIELHPLVADDARKEAMKRPRMTVHEGPWQTVVPTLPGRAYDVVFYDPFNLTCGHFGEKQRFEKWGLPVALWENLMFYRLLRPGGVLVQYAVSHGGSVNHLLQHDVAPLFTELRHVKVKHLKTEDGCNYVKQEQGDAMDAPALIK